MNTHNIPTIRRIALTDLGVFIIFSIAFILLPLLAFVSFVELWPFSRENYSESVIVIEIIISTWLIFFSIGLWWSKVIQHSFIDGHYLKGKIIGFDKPVGPFFSVTYEFDFMEKRITQRVAFINSKSTKKLTELKSINVLYDPRKKRSFIYEAFV